jgi:hypothetical protein
MDDPDCRPSTILAVLRVPRRDQKILQAEVLLRELPGFQLMADTDEGSRGLALSCHGLPQCENVPRANQDTASEPLPIQVAVTVAFILDSWSRI